MKAVDIGTRPSTFECVATRISSSLSTCVVVVIYRTGPVTANFFVELSDILDRLSTSDDQLVLSGDQLVLSGDQLVLSGDQLVQSGDQLVLSDDQLVLSGDQLVLSGDINIHLERSFDTTTAEFIDFFACYDLVQHVTGAIHNACGNIDIICTRRDLPPQTVDVIDVGLLNHRLLGWASIVHHQPMLHLPPTCTCRILQSFDAATFWTNLSVSALTSRFRCITCHRRPLCLWFDDECTRAK